LYFLAGKCFAAEINGTLEKKNNSISHAVLPDYVHILHVKSSTMT
jgi:hypothetical protein